MSAQSSEINAHQLLAGNQAKCSANSFPEIMVGSGKSESADIVKRFTDEFIAVEGELSPNFF